MPSLRVKINKNTVPCL